MRIALGLEYDGSRFCGWQTQPQGCAVQDALERALAEVAGGPVETICAGRTDAGVHALAQVVHFDTAAERPESAWVRGVNALLPPPCAVSWSRPVAQDFHARYSALARTYRYLLLFQIARKEVSIKNKTATACTAAVRSVARASGCRQPRLSMRFLACAFCSASPSLMTSWRISLAPSLSPISW